MKRSSVLVVCGMLVCALVAQAADIAFNITLSDVGGNASALVADFAAATGWTANISDGMGGTIPNPLNRAQHSKGKIEQYVRETVKAYRAHQKADTARTKEVSDADALIIFK